MKKNIKRLLFIILIMIILLPAQAVFAETLEERLNNLIGPQEQYNTMLSPVYLQNNALEESISAQSGELSLAQTDYVLPGRNGLDLEIKRLYKSGTSNVKEMKVKYVSGAWVDYVQADAGTSSFYEDRYNLGIGMRFSFAGIEIRKNDDGTSHKFLHTEAGDVYRLTGPKTEDGVQTYLPENQTIKDVKIVENKSFSNGQSDGTSFFMMTGNDGKKTYFAQDGRILGIADRYGNTITFEYITQTYTIDGVTRTKKLISRITDTIGRVVTIEYREDYRYKVTAKNDAPYGKEESYKQSQNPNSIDSGDLNGKFQVVVNLPGNKKIVYDKSAVLIGNNKNVVRTRLQRVYDADGQPKFHYWYEQTDLGFTYTNGSNYSVYNRYENLIQIDFLRTNQIKRYTYNTFTRRLADNGSLQYRKIFEKKDMSKKEYDSSKSNFIGRFICDVKNKISYNYTNEADGYSFSGYNENNETYLKDTYRYGTKISFMEGTTEKYHIYNTYNGIHELINVDNKGEGHRETTITEYDEMKFPKKKETLTYNIVNGKESGSPVSKIENYRYDEFGNLTNYTGPIANRDAAGYPVDTEHTVIYSYAYDKYHVPQLKTWKNDSDTICQIKYDIDAQGNVTRETRMLGNTPDTWPVTDFSYDTYGNLIKQEVHSQEGTYVTNYEYGSDLNGKDHKGAYLTRRYTTVEGKEISSKYAYDHNTGGITGESDGNNNLTRFEYDLLGRVIKQIQPDGTIKQYDYLDFPYSDKQIMYTDPEGTKLLYEYDISGNLLKASVYDQDKWNDLKKISYDSSGNKVKETDANGHSVRFEYNSQNKLVKRANYENDTVKKSEMTLGYIHAIDADSVMQVNITDEEGNLQKYFYDVNEKLVKTQMTPDNIVYYTSVYEYDYTGNNISQTGAGNNRTVFKYDQLGRLICTTNALGGTTKNTYNTLDNILLIEEPGGRMTQYIYDELARVVMEKVYKKGSQDYSYIKYVYDNTDNVITQVQGSLKAGTEIIHTQTDNLYNAMNLATDQYIKVDEENAFHIHNTYDKNGRKIKTLEYANKEENKYREYNYAYDFAGRLASEGGIYKEINAAGGITEYGNSLKKYEYDYVGNIKKLHVSTDSGFITSTFSYDYNNRLISKTEPYTEQKAKETKYSYDRKGNLLSEILTVQGKQTIKSFKYDGLSRVIEQISPEGGITTYIYDARNNLTKEISPEYYGMTVNSAPGLEYEYDELNRQYKIIAYDGTSREVITYREFDERGNIIKEADSFGYNKNNPIQSIGAVYEYDVNNNVVRYISAQTAYENKANGTNKFTTKNGYDGAGRLTSSQDAYGGITVYEYYMNGKLKLKQNPDSSKENYSYDLSGRIEEAITDVRGNTRRTFNSIYGKPYRFEYSDDTFETFEYSRDGKLKKSLDRSGNIKLYEYNLAGNMTAQKEYVRSDATYDGYRLFVYTYDEAGNKLSEETFECRTPKGMGADLITSAGDRVDYEYDRASMLTKITGPEGRQVVNQYNLSGNIVKQSIKTDVNYSDVRKYAYDFRGRLLSETLLVEASDINTDYLIGAGYDNEFSSRIVSRAVYEYYGNGKLKSKKDGSGNSTSYEYNLDGSVKRNTNALNQSTVYKYDAMGSLIQQTDPSGNSVWFEYDNMDRLIRQKQFAPDGGLAITRYIYDYAGNLVKQIQPNEYDSSLDSPELAETMKGISYIYDNMNRKTSTLSPDDEILELISYDANGNIKKAIDGLRYDGSVITSAGTSYTYDGLNRVITVIDALDNTFTYEYDISGNLIKQIDARNNEFFYEYNSDKTLEKALYPDGGTVEYTYDYQGRMITQKDQRGSITTYSYNAFGKIRAVSDSYGNTTSYKYDLNGNPVSIKDKSDSVTLIKYDALNRPIENRIPLELDASRDVIYSIEKYSYDAAGNLVKRILSGTKCKFDSREVNYTYYQNNLPATVTDSAGGYTKNYYDKNGNILKILTLRDDEKYDIQKFEYDAMNRMTKDIKLSEKEDIFNTVGMAGYGNLIDSEYPDMIALITAYEYDILGNLIKGTQPRAFEYALGDNDNIEQYIVSYSYDALNRLERVSGKYDGIDVQTTYQYDELGNKTRVIDELGNETLYTYDSMNRVISYTDACGNTFSYTYDKAGNKLTETNPKNNTMTYTYDKLNRLETVTDPYNIVITTNSYDTNGNLIEAEDAKGYATEYVYDLANRVIKVTDPEAEALGGFTVSYEYNQYGEKINETDGLGNTTGYEYDRVGRLVRITDALGISTLYTYGKAGNKLSMTDGRGITTYYVYGSFGKMTSMLDADGKEVLYSYDLMGSKACETDRNGNILIYSNNSRGLLTEKNNVNTGNIVTYSYDSLGNRTGMIDESGERSYLYDGSNRLLREMKGAVTQLSYTYDSIGNMESVTDVKGFRTSYTYDKANRMETVSYDGRTVTYTYDLNGNRQSITYPGGVKEEYSYDKNNRLLKLTNRKPDNSVVSQYSYTYDISGRETSKTDSYGTTYYTYDKAGRVLKVEAPGKTTAYAYDKSGNRTSLIETYTSNQPAGFINEATKNEVEYILKKSQYVYSDTNRLLKLVEEMYSASDTKVLTKSTQYIYDNNGNELARYSSFIHPNGDDLKRLIEASVHGENQSIAPDSLIDRSVNTFDGFNRLKRVETISSGVRTLVEYTYNGGDLRTQKEVRKSDNNYASEITSFLYDRQHVILETDGTNTVKVRYIRGINYIARYNDQAELNYYLYNGHGDVVQTITEEGEVQNQYDYDIFGNATLTIEISECSIRYAGEYLDNETGLYYLRARYYNPYTGRFISEDSYWGEDSNPLSLNLYTYAYNDPIRYIDPSGYRPEDVRHDQKLAIARLDELKKMLFTLTEEGANLAFIRPVNSCVDFLREKVLKYEQDEELIGLIQSDSEGKAGSWEEYRLRKTVESITYKTFVDLEDKELDKDLIRRQSVALALAVNLDRPIFYDDQDDLFNLIMEYPLISQKGIYDVIRSGEELSDRITLQLDLYLRWSNNSNRVLYEPRPSLEWSYNKLELTNRGNVVESDQRSLVSQQGIQNFIDNYNKKNKIPLTVKQEKALYKINDYSDSDIIKNLGPDELSVLFFEGAGDYFGENHLKDEYGKISRKGKNHSRGRFGAMVVVVENGEIVFMSLRASTLPDKPKAQNGTSFGHNTILPGEYYIKSDYAGGSQKHVGFATGRSPNPQQGVGDDVPVYRFFDINGKNNPGIYDKGSGKFPVGSGDDIHAGWDTSKSNSSTGCLTIYNFRNFMDAIGMEDIWFTKDPYFKDPDLKMSIPLPVITGAVVVDRTFADPDYLKEMYTRDDAVDTIMGR